MVPGVKVAFPNLETWVQGEPESAFAPGKVYVFEFFHTNCSHCREWASLIHELARVNEEKGARFVAISEETAETLRAWLEQPGRKEAMPYAVVSDPDRSAMNTFQNGTFRNFNPRFFVVKDGIVQWYGHPNQAEKPLARIMAGDWDIDAARPEAILDAQVSLAKSRLDAIAVECNGSGDWARMYELLDSVIEALPERAGQYKAQRFLLMIGLGDQVDQGYGYGRQVAKDHADEASTMRLLARVVLAAPYTRRRDIDFGLECAVTADRLSDGKDSRAADVLALAWFSKGDATAAIEHELRAIALEPNAKQRREYERALEHYRTSDPSPVPVRPAPPAGGAVPPSAPGVE
jgi:thiol-disulfide isomerase/thioredoxin